MDTFTFRSEDGNVLRFEGRRVAYYEDNCYEDLCHGSEASGVSRDYESTGYSYRVYKSARGPWYLIHTKDIAYWKTNGDRGVKPNVSAEWWSFESESEAAHFVAARARNESRYGMHVSLLADWGMQEYLRA